MFTPSGKTVAQTRVSRPVSLHSASGSQDIPLNSTPATGHTPQDADEHLLPGSRSKSKRPITLDILKQWYLECTCWTLSLLLYVAVITLLWAYKDHKAPDFGPSISLNAIIALITTFAEALLMVAITSVLGQLKWLFVDHRQRRLGDFVRIDNASRGAYGSLMLLVSRQGGFAPLFGSILIVLALASHFFAQETIKYRAAFTTTSDATVPIARYMNVTGSTFYPSENNGMHLINGMELNMVPAIYQGIYGTQGSQANITASCNSGNCKWETYATLAICNTCVNLTQELSTVTMNHPAAPSSGVSDPYTDNTYELPSGFQLSGLTLLGGDVSGFSVLNISATVLNDSGFFSWSTDSIYTPYNKSVAFQNASSVLLGLTAIGLSPQGLPTQPSDPSEAYNPSISQAPPVAYECLLQMCVREINATSTNGTLHETIVNTITDSVINGRSINDIFLTFYSPATKETFYADQFAVDSVASWLAALMQGNVTAQEEGLMPPTSTIAEILQRMTDSDSGFPDIMQSIADQMTFALRQTSYQPRGALGVSLLPTTLVGVRFAWLAYPLALLISGLALLVFVMWKSHQRHRPPWTNNALATLLHGLNRPPVLAEGAAIDTLAEMEEVGRNVRVELLREDLGRDRLVVYDGEDG